ncbi:MAG: hypothetical protein JRI23_08975 [Deltaproteobacteria bacterium]|jgi:hypothetical protein|nr:hypothetical protein [Deltaproteobacteria bacterium]MBW2531770.1 hypothetical protein [Deltaproteobacteria bacterium]
MRGIVAAHAICITLLIAAVGCGDEDDEPGGVTTTAGGVGGTSSGTGGSPAGGGSTATGSGTAGQGGQSVGGSGATSDCPNEGYLEPNVGVNVGVPNGVQLSTVTANDGEFHRITTDGEVIDGKLIEACVVIEADDVVIRNSHIRCTMDQMNEGAYVGAIDVNAPAQNALIEHNTIECYGATDDREWCRYGINGPNFTARFNDIFGGTDGVVPWNDAIFECNYVHHLPRRPVPYQPDGYSHNDGVQGMSGYAEIRGNYFEGNTQDNGQAIFFQTESVAHHPVAAIIENNYLAGFWKNIIQCNRKSGMLAVDCQVDFNVIRDEDVNLQTNGQRWLTIGIQNGATGSAACNTWGDGSFIPDGVVVGVTHDTSSCP